MSLSLSKPPKSLQSHLLLPYPKNVILLMMILITALSLTTRLQLHKLPVIQGLAISAQATSRHLPRLTQGDNPMSLAPY
jgi:hypothetical protein